MTMYSADRKFTFLHVDYGYAGYTQMNWIRDCYLDFDRIFTVSDKK